MTTPTITNCSFDKNNAEVTNSVGGGLYSSRDSSPASTAVVTVVNSIFWENRDTDGATTEAANILHVGNAALPTVTYSSIKSLDTQTGAPYGDPADGNENINANPSFFDQLSGDLEPRILEFVPETMNAGNNSAVPADIYDADDDGDMDEDTPDAHLPFRNTSVTVDMGAYEYPAIHVDPLATGDGDGTSWTDAYTTLQAAMDFGEDRRGQIWLKRGTYKPTTCSGSCTDTDRAVSFELRRTVCVWGGFLGTETDFSLKDPDNLTILSGNIDTTGDADSYHVVTADATIDVDTKKKGYLILWGLKIRDGRADGSAARDKKGGGILIEDAEFGVVECAIGHNTAIYGGGVACLGDQHISRVPAFNIVLFHDNSATHGGGVYSDTLATSCHITSFFENSVTGNGGAVYNTGTLSVIQSPVYASSVFRDNTADGNGGAVYNTGGTEPLLHASENVCEKASLCRYVWV